MKKITVVISLLLGVTLLLLSACSSGATVPAATTRTFYVNAIEIKGATDGIDGPTIDPSTLSEGYGYKEAGVYDSSNADKWQVASYMFEPSALTVFQGDTVKLILFVLNGDVHADRVEDPDGAIVVAETTHNRGRQYTISFDADKAGIYQLRCKEHRETMRMAITVIPR